MDGCVQHLYCRCCMHLPYVFSQSCVSKRCGLLACDGMKNSFMAVRVREISSCCLGGGGGGGGVVVAAAVVAAVRVGI